MNVKIKTDLAHPVRSGFELVVKQGDADRSVVVPFVSIISSFAGAAAAIAFGRSSRPVLTIGAVTAGTGVVYAIAANLIPESVKTGPF